MTNPSQLTETEERANELSAALRQRWQRRIQLLRAQLGTAAGRKPTP